MRNHAKIAMTTAVLIGLSAVAASGGTFAAFSGSTENSGNSFNAGTVSLTDNDAGAALFTAPAMKPSDTAASCIQVTYTGTIPTPVRLYGATTGSLGTALTLKVERGTITTPTFPSCTGFTADTPTYVAGQSAGTVYSGTLAAFPSTYATGVALPATAWVTNEKRVYRFTVTLPSSAPDSAQGQSAATTFTWEAQS